MPPERFFVERPPEGGIARLSREEAHHLRHVRRVKAGDEVVLFDGSGIDYAGRVGTLGRAGATVEILRQERVSREPAVAVTLAVAVVKQQGVHQLVDTCTQLGVRRLVPMRTARTVVKPGANSVERWRRIAIEACKQCGRSVVPEIADVRDMADVLADDIARHDLAVVAAMRPGGRRLTELMRAGPRSVLCLIGPEGGFTDEEEQGAVEAGCVPVTLGPTVLRTETAAAAALALVVQLACSDDGGTE